MVLETPETAGVRSRKRGEAGGFGLAGLRQEEVVTEKGWKILRLVLGILQIAGAGISLGALVQTAISTLSLVAVIVTGLFTTVSVLLFGGRPFH